MTPCEAILEAVDQSGRSDRSVSLAAVGHHSCVSNLRKNEDIRVSTAEALCRELELEFYIGPPRRVSTHILEALELGTSSSLEDALVEISKRRQRAERHEVIEAIRQLEELQRTAIRLLEG